MGWVANRRGTASLSLPASFSRCGATASSMTTEMARRVELWRGGAALLEALLLIVMPPISPADTWPPWAEGARAHAGGRVERLRRVKEMRAAAPQGATPKSRPSM
jgi:hypothetical protein